MCVLKSITMINIGLYSKKIRFLMVMAVLVLCVAAPLAAYPRISFGASWAGMSLQGTVAGDEYGTMVSKSNGLNITLEGEAVPVEQWALIFRGQANVFKPVIESNGVAQPQNPDAVLPIKATGRFGIATGWQLPFSDWTLRDFPLDLTVGLGAVLNMMHLSYDTPLMHYSATELALGAAAYLSLSWYFSPHFGLSFSTMPGLTVMDWTTTTTTATSGAPVKKDSLTFTSLKFSWDATLAATIRFGW